MTLDYKIIVVDDQPQYVRAALRELKTDIELDGFDFSHETINNPPAFEQLSRRSDIATTTNLLWVDKNLGLGAGQDGATMIRRLRARAPHLPVLFYSSEATTLLRARIATEGIDGVFCCGRTEVRAESLNIFRAQAKSLLRPGIVRGFVVSEASELDHRMREAIKHCVRHLSEAGHMYVREEIINQIAALQQTLTAHIEATREGADLDSMLDGQKVSSANLLHILRGLLERFPDQRQAAPFLGLLETYLEEVIHPRNVLAHGRPSLCGNFIELGTRQFPLTDRTTREQRSMMKRHLQNIHALCSHLVGRTTTSTPTE